MTRQEMKTATSNQLIIDLVLTSSRLSVNINIGLGTLRLSAHMDDLLVEMEGRGILTKDDVSRLKR